MKRILILKTPRLYLPNRFLNLNGSLRGDMMWICDSTGKTNIAVASAATVYTQAIPIPTADNLGVFVLLSGSAPQITITPQQSYQPPAVANINGSDPNYVQPTGVAAICTGLTQTTPLIQTLSLVPMKYLRFQIVGGASNGANTTVQFGIFNQELIA